MLALLAALALASRTLPPPTPRDELRSYPGVVTRVVDGDTVEVRVTVTSRTGRTRVRTMNLRLYGVDAPERGQTWGDRATDALRRRVLGREIELRHVDDDGFGRPVVLLYLDGSEVNAELVAAGHAWAFRKYLGDLEGDEAYCRLEYDARAAGAGLWGQRRHAPPWAHRHGGEGRSRVDRERSPADCVANFERR